MLQVKYHPDLENMKDLLLQHGMVDLDDNIVFISDKGDISSILANGFVEKLGFKNIYSLEGGVQKIMKENIKLIRN